MYYKYTSNIPSSKQKCIRATATEKKAFVIYYLMEKQSVCV